MKARRKKLSRHPRVLIVDDEPLLIDIYSSAFKKHGFDVITAQNGVEGLKRAVEDDPSIIILDILMPIKSGYDLLKDLKNNPKTKSVPVLVLTALNKDYQARRGIKLGADQYMVKDKATLEEIVEEAKRLLAGDHKEGS